MNNSIKISVIMPVYNVKDFLRECMDSLIHQTLKEIEIICVDDESSDGSYDILLEYVQKDDRVKVIRQKNGGAGAARNNGLQYATGEYLSILDADDFYELDMLEKAYSKVKEQDSDIVVFACDHYDNSEKTYSPNNYSIHKNLLPENSPFAGVDVPKDIFKLFVGWSWDKLFKTSFIQENNLKFQEQRTTNDMLFVFSAVVKAQKIVILDEVLVHHRREAGSLSVTREKSWHCFYDALVALKKQLMEWNLYERFQQDFINYCVHFSLWNLNTLKEPTHTLLYNKLRDEWFDSLDVIEHPESYFYNKYEYKQYRLIYEHSLDEKISKDTVKEISKRKNQDLISKAMYTLKDKGLIYTMKKAIRKFAGKDRN